MSHEKEEEDLSASKIMWLYQYEDSKTTSKKVKKD